MPSKLSQEIKNIPKIGPAYQARLEHLGIKTVKDLLYHFPTRYEDFSTRINIADLKVEETACVQGIVESVKMVRVWKRHLTITEIVISDETGKVKALWFNQPYLAKMTPEGSSVRIEGKVSERRSTHELYLSNPKIEVVNELPAGSADSLFGGDAEMHNLYPVIYAKQMARGFEEHTQRRAMVYSAGGYAGVQQFVASWAGDTGGGPKPLASMLNHGFSGYANHSCDMDVFSVEGIHFGFLQTWAQQCNWAYWRQPWLLEDEQIAAFRAYDQLRYKLLPYLYSTAAGAALTGYPVMRAMSMVYPDDPAWDTKLGQYMLGDFLLVSAFSKEVCLPKGEWVDFWTGKRITGPATLPVQITPQHGGALFVKDGAIIPTWPPRDHVEKGWSPEVGLMVYPAASSSFTLHEDDGTSLDYRKSKFSRTRLTCEANGKTVRLTIGGREGSYAGMPATRDFTATIHLSARPKTVTLDGAAVADWQWSDETSAATITIPECGKTARVVVCD